MAQIRKIGVVSSSKFLTVLMAFLGLIAGIVYSFGGFIYDLFTIGLNTGTALAFFALLGMPIIFAIPGLVIGAICAFLYNLVAGWIGGIEMEFEQEG